MQNNVLRLIKVGSSQIFGLSFLLVLLAVVFIPLPGPLIDVLVMVSFLCSALLFLVVLENQQPLNLSFFPSVLLLLTVFRLLLSIATTKNILAGRDVGVFISSIGDLVLDGVIASGLVIFIIITVVQFLVVTKGAERVAEVGARFSLDAMPGKQMSIDSDLKSGAISGEEAQSKRELLSQESRLMGALDGAMKFVKGDAIAGILISMVNIIGGLYIGSTVFNMSLDESLMHFTILTIGDGLVSQIPSLILCLACGVYLTRMNDERKTKSSDSLYSQVNHQISPFKNQLYALSLICLLIALIPDAPVVILLLVSIFIFIFAFRIEKHSVSDVVQNKLGPLNDITIEIPKNCSLDVERIKAEIEKRFYSFDLGTYDIVCNENETLVIKYVGIDVVNVNVEDVINAGFVRNFGCVNVTNVDVALANVVFYSTLNYVSKSIDSMTLGRILEAGMRDFGLEDEVEKSVGKAKLKEIVRILIRDIGFFCPVNLLIESVISISKQERDLVKISDFVRNKLKFNLINTYYKVVDENKKFPALLLHPSFEELIETTKVENSISSSYDFELEVKSQIDTSFYNAFNNTVNDAELILVVTNSSNRYYLSSYINSLQANVVVLNSSEFFDFDSIHVAKVVGEPVADDI